MRVFYSYEKCIVGNWWIPGASGMIGMQRIWVPIPPVPSVFQSMTASICGRFKKFETKRKNE